MLICLRVASIFVFQERDNVIGKVYRRLMEIESRLLPCGLHTVGVPPTSSEAVATLVNIASLDRPEDGIKSLPRIAAESIGREIGEIYSNADKGMLEDVQLLQQVLPCKQFGKKYRMYGVCLFDNNASYSFLHMMSSVY